VEELFDALLISVSAGIIIIIIIIKDIYIAQDR